MRTCAAYDATIRSIGFDEVRVRYRQKRRALIREIIQRKLKGDVLLHYIQSIGSRDVDLQDQEEFIQDTLGDLEQMDESRLAGLGVTLDELKAWQDQ